jgi:aminopeptidase N
MLRRPSVEVLLTLLLPALIGSGCRAAGRSGGVRLEFPRERAHAPRIPAFDVLEYAIELELQPETRAIRGLCRVQLRVLEEPIDEVQLDLVGLEVEGVSDAHGQALAFRREGGRLLIDLGRSLEPGTGTGLAIRYGGVPERGLWYAGKRADGSGPTLIFSHGQTEGSRGWFPCFDEPGERAATEITLTMPGSWIAVASGERVEARVDGARRRERWRMEFPHPPYLLGVVAGELVVQEERAGEVPLQFLSEPRFAEWIEPTFAETDEILAFLEEFTGLPYPYPKYSQAAVDNFPWGGMENISATTLTPWLLSDERGHRDQPPFFLIAHEAAHQWFGNLFTCADWAHLWLNEGFATYLTLLYLERTRGTDEFRAELHEVQQAYLAQDVGPERRPTVWSTWKEPDDVFDARAYQGGAARLHLLRFVLGEDAFRAGLGAYAAESVGRSVVTSDLRGALERASGRDLRLFFEQWFLSPGFPEFVVAWHWDEHEREVVLEVEQVQDGDGGTPAVFVVPVEIELRDARGPHAFRVELDERRERFELPAPEPPLYLSFDAHGWIPKRVQQEREPAEWLALAALADDVNARREAVRALGRLARASRERGGSGEAELAELVARLATDASPWVRADAATALGEAGGAEAEEALRRAAVDDGEARVRAAALLALRPAAPDAGLASLGEEAFYSERSYRAMAAAAGLLCRAAPERAFEFLGVALELESPHDALAALLLPHLAGLPDARVPSELRRWAADRSLAPAARAVAVEQLGATTRDTMASSAFLVPFLEEESFHVRRAAVHALTRFGDVGACRALESYYPRARTAEERRTIEALLEPRR